MIQSRTQFNLTCNDYNSLCSKNEFYPIQKAYSTPHFVVLVVRFRGKTRYLYVGRGHRYQGFYLSEQAPPAYLRVQDRLLDYVRKHLVGARIAKVSSMAEKKYFEFEFKTIGDSQFIGWGYKDRNLFFVLRSEQEVFLSFSGLIVKEEFWRQKIDDLQIDSWDRQEKDYSIESYLNEQSQKSKGEAVIKKKEKFLLKKISNIDSDLKKAQQWSEISRSLEQNEIDLDSSEIIIGDHKIKFNNLKTQWQKRNVVFEKIKKLKKAQELLTLRLNETNQEYLNLKKGEIEMTLTKEKAIQPLWSSEKAKKRLADDKTNEEFKNISIASIPGSLGLSAQGNDQIRKLASRDHFWFHLENETGAHVILKTDDISRLSLVHLASIASLLRDFSGLKVEEISLMYTQVKNVRAIKGKAGMVSVTKPKYLRCVYLPWTEIISVH